MAVYGGTRRYIDWICAGERGAGGVLAPADFGALLKALHHLHNQWQLLQAIQLLLHAQIPLFIIWCDHPWARLPF
jgi:hypothetical protein